MNSTSSQRTPTEKPSESRQFRRTPITQTSQKPTPTPENTSQRIRITPEELKGQDISKKTNTTGLRKTNMVITFTPKTTADSDLRLMIWVFDIHRNYAIDKFYKISFYGKIWKFGNLKKLKNLFILKF